MREHDIVIIGGGPAGMAAAISAYDAGVKDIVILEREPEIGGILRQCIHAGFGLHKFGEELTGPEYAARYKAEVEKRNIRVVCNTMVREVARDKIVIAQNREGILKIQAKAIILTMGCRERSRGALNIPGDRPAGVYSAGTAQKLINCDGYMIGKRVVILGSGDIGLIMARRMTLEGATVEAVCELMPYSGGLTRNIVQCLEDFDIPLHLSTTVCQIHGKKRLEGVTIARVDKNNCLIEETKQYIPCDTLLLSVGLIPENELTKGAGIIIDPITNGARVDENCQTSIPGIFACGNVLHVHDLVDYVSEESENAGINAAEFVLKQTGFTDTVLVKPGKGVRYVVPQVLHKDRKKVTLLMRVTQPFGKSKLVVYADNVITKSVIRQRAVPGEMEKITLDTQYINPETREVSVVLEVLE